MNTLSVIRPIRDDATKRGVKYIMKSAARGQNPTEIQEKGNAQVAIRQLEEESVYWKLEVAVLLKLISRLDRRYLHREDQYNLSKLERECTLFLEKILPGHQLELTEIRRRTNNDLARSVERSHRQLRNSYQQLKSDLMPLLPRMIPVTIW